MSYLAGAVPKDGGLVKQKRNLILWVRRIGGRSKELEAKRWS
jgi:hypothetical protein